MDEDIPLPDVPGPRRLRLHGCNCLAVAAACCLTCWHVRHEPCQTVLCCCQLLPLRLKPCLAVQPALLACCDVLLVEASGGATELSHATTPGKRVFVGCCTLPNSSDQKLKHQ